MTREEEFLRRLRMRLRVWVHTPGEGLKFNGHQLTEATLYAMARDAENVLRGTTLTASWSGRPPFEWTVKAWVENPPSDVAIDVFPKEWYE